MNKNLKITSVLGILAIFLGAFGAHAFKKILTIDGLHSFEAAVRYQMYHVLVLLVVNMYAGFTAKQKNNISYLLFIGILFFSGSIYAMQLANIPAKMIWFLTPLGGFFFIAGWIVMLLNFLKKKSTINS